MVIKFLLQKYFKKLNQIDKSIFCEKIRYLNKLDQITIRKNEFLTFTFKFKLFKIRDLNQFQHKNEYLLRIRKTASFF